VPDRLPDFVVIGTMKSGTTSLFRWLGEHDLCVLPAVKEPAYFATADADGHGLVRYRSLFAAVPDGAITGEASVAYTAPDLTAGSASRLLATTPGARLVCVLRHPIDRLRSHHEHERLRGRERRRLADAVTGDDVYTRTSCYGSCLDPWLDHAADGQLLVVRLEDLAGPDDAAWHTVLAHIGLEPSSRPDGRHNTSWGKEAYGPVMRRLYDAGVRRPPSWAPTRVRRAARRVLLRPAPAPDPASTVARAAVERIWADVDRLEHRLGRTFGWDRSV
jgi:hypothetical protein